MTPTEVPEAPRTPHARAVRKEERAAGCSESPVGPLPPEGSDRGLPAGPAVNFVLSAQVRVRVPHDLAEAPAGGPVLTEHGVGHESP